MDQSEWKCLDVEIPDDLLERFSDEEQKALRDILALDPRPHYQDDPERVYGMPFGRYDVRFMVGGNSLKVVECVLISDVSAKK